MQSHDHSYIWHPFTQMADFKGATSIVKGEGVWLTDKFGNRYLDAVSSWWVNLFGHSNPVIAEAIAKQSAQMEHVMFDTFTHSPAVDLAKLLIDQLGEPFAKVFYSDNGSTAVEVALKMAIQYWFNKNEEKPLIIAFNSAYHGDTFGSMSVGGRNIFNRAYEPFLFDVKHIEPPIHNPDNSISQLEQLIEANKGKIAAFIFEPLVMGAAGMQMYAPEHLDKLIGLAKENNIICIADEVMTGFGRTGKFFAIDYLKNKPDIIALSKGITGGFMPFGATLCSKKIFNAFLSNPSDGFVKTFFHGHSYTGNPIACAAAVASFSLLKLPKTWDHIAMINSLHKAFAEQLRFNKKVEKVEVTGTILAVRLKSDNSGYLNPLREKIYPFFLSRKIILRPLGNVIYVLPPYVINEQELSLVYEAIEEFIDSEITENNGY
jgi:adenosylmethionine-8-amino-7-oxononanoate aminotransferase